MAHISPVLALLQSRIVSITIKESTLPLVFTKRHSVSLCR